MIIRREGLRRGRPDGRGVLPLLPRRSTSASRRGRAGWPCWYVPQSRIMHIGGQSTKLTERKTRPGRTPGYWFTSRSRYFRKNFGRTGAIGADLGFGLGLPSGEPASSSPARATTTRPTSWPTSGRTASSSDGRRPEPRPGLAPTHRDRPPGQAFEVLALMKSSPCWQRPKGSGEEVAPDLGGGGQRRQGAGRMPRWWRSRRSRSPPGRPSSPPSRPGRCPGCPGRSPRRGRGSSPPRTRRSPPAGPSPRCASGTCRTSSSRTGGRPPGRTARRRRRWSGSSSRIG